MHSCDWKVTHLDWKVTVAAPLQLQALCLGVQVTEELPLLPRLKILSFFHMLKKALAVEAAGNFEYHVCAHGEYAFPDACGRQDYHLHEHEVCICAQPVSICMHVCAVMGSKQGA